MLILSSLQVEDWWAWAWAWMGRIVPNGSLLDEEMCKLLICTKVPKWIGCLVIRVESCKEIFYLKGPPRPPLVVAFRVCPKMFVPIEIARTRNKKDYRAIWGGLSGDKLQAQTNVCDQVHIEKKIVGIQPNINTPNKKIAVSLLQLAAQPMRRHKKKQNDSNHNQILLYNDQDVQGREEIKIVILWNTKTIVGSHSS